MYICVCNAVTDKQIQVAAENGASSLSDLSAQLGVAACCGACAGLATQVLAEAVAEQPGHSRWYSAA